MAVISKPFVQPHDSMVNRLSCSELVTLASGTTGMEGGRVRRGLDIGRAESVIKIVTRKRTK